MAWKEHLCPGVQGRLGDGEASGGALAGAREQPEGAYGALITTRTPDLRHRERALDKPEVFCCADTSESPHTIMERVNIE